MFLQPTTLIVVYKDEMLANQLKKLVETNDDTAESVIGVRDGSVEIVAWNEKTWTAQKKAGNITSKVLFLGDVKGTDKLKPVIDEKFNSFGVKYGWAGKQAIIYADDTIIKDHEVYLKFAEEFNKLPVPESYKYVSKAVDNILSEEDTTEGASDGIELNETVENKAKKENNFFNKFKDKLDEAGSVVMKFGNDAAHIPQNIKEKNTAKTQLMLYGIIKLYYDGLETFINS